MEDYKDKDLWADGSEYHHARKLQSNQPSYQPQTWVHKFTNRPMCFLLVGPHWTLSPMSTGTVTASLTVYPIV